MKKNSLKKIAALVLSLGMAGSLAACGGSGSSASGSGSSASGSGSSAPAETTAASDAVYRTLDEIKADGKINIGVFSDKNPFGYVDENGEYQGYDVYFANRLGEDLGVEINYVSTEAANRVEYLETGKVDVILANFTVTADRAEKVDFTLPYMNVSLGVVSPDSNVITDLSQIGADDEVIVISGTTAETYLTENNPEIKLQKYDTYANAKNALENGQAVAWANDNTEVIAYSIQNPGYTVGIPELGSQDTIAAAVSKGNSSLLDWINEEIKTLGAENFFHADYEATLMDTYGAEFEDTLVVEGGEAAAPEAESEAAPAAEASDIPQGNGETIKVAASTIPHAEILAEAKPILEANGWNLEVTEFEDYVQPNMVVEQGEFDANYFQHIPYLDSFNEEHGTHLVNAGGIHYEPFGIYPDGKTSLDEIADGDVIAVPNDTTNEARALLLLQDNGIITLKDGAGLTATVNDIAENPHNVDIKELEAAAIPRSMGNGQFAFVILNGNYALQAGLSAEKDSIAHEASDSEAAQTYVNVIAVKEGSENSDSIKALITVLKSEEIKNFINSKYDGAVVPFE
jgi:YaeC family lipoprotein